MFASLLALLSLSSSAPAVPDSAATPRAAPDSVIARAAADSAAALPRPVRIFPPVDVRAPLYDLRSSQTVHVLSGPALRTLPVDGLAEAVALEPGVVAQAEELHVRGGRTGETPVLLDDLPLGEPRQQRAFEPPLLAVASAELLSGVADARHPGALAGVLDLHSVDPGARPSLAWRWQTDGGRDTHFDRLSARLSGPLGVRGLGAVVAGDATFDNTYLPALRTPSVHEVAGFDLGWRAENRMIGFLKLAPVQAPARFSIEATGGRVVREPYDAQWTLDGWTYISPNPKEYPIYSPVPLPGYQHYFAPDHNAIIDERRLAVQASAGVHLARARGTVRLGWMRTRSVLSPSGQKDTGSAIHRALYQDYGHTDIFHVVWGDYPLYRESGSDVVVLRGDADLAPRAGVEFKAGAALTHEQVTLSEFEWLPIGYMSEGLVNNVPVDADRSYDATAPGAAAYFQGRWDGQGMVVNGGLRAEYFTPGPDAAHQTLPWDGRGVVTFSPRFGLAYPISVRDAFSFSYVRIRQSPPRDVLYDDRVVVLNGRPLGNPAIVPSTLVSYEAAVKHLYGPECALQGALFYRDVWDQVGARDYTIPGGPTDMRYENADVARAVGFELSFLWSRGVSRRFELHYTWLDASGAESRAEGEPFGPLVDPRIPPTGDYPLSWDRRHSITAGGAWSGSGRWAVAWATAVGSPLPWTPRERRQDITDLSVINSQRLGWTETTNLDVHWTPPRTRGLRLGLEVRNLFDHRGDRLATLDGYPNPIINTLYDDYGAYRNETGNGGGAYWSGGTGGTPAHWERVGDPRLAQPPRTVRLSLGADW